jgi:uncharacterized protein (TIGR02246 family)
MASLFDENGTFVTPQGDFLQGRAAMVKDFGPEAQQAVNATTQAAFSNYRIRFIKPDVAVSVLVLCFLVLVALAFAIRSCRY